MRKKPLYYIHHDNHYIVMLLQQDLPHYMVLTITHFTAYRKELEAKGFSFFELLTFELAMKTYLESLQNKETDGYKD